MRTVYALSAKGQQERSAAKPNLPSELGQLLRLIDGRSTDDDLLATLSDTKSAVKAGGLRWLKASGYIVPTQSQAAPPQPKPKPRVNGAHAHANGKPPAPRAPAPAQPPESPSAPIRVNAPAPPPSAPIHVSAPVPPISAPMRAGLPSWLPSSASHPGEVAVSVRTAEGAGTGHDTYRMLADYMRQAIGRWLGAEGYRHQDKLAGAASMDDLLPHLNPLIDAIAAKSGPEAGAEFADTAAFILNPREDDYG
jgi:hypothetical protein